MDIIENLVKRNAAFAETGFHPELKMMPSLKTLIIGCVDPRVDPIDVLGLEPGETAVVRNVGGRVNPSLLDTLAMLKVVSQANGGDMGPGWNLVVLQHTHCGINGCYHHAPGLIADYMGVAEDALEALAITDPYKAVQIDIEALRANPAVSGAFTVSGLVYDVATGLIETVVAPALLRQGAN